MRIKRDGYWYILDKNHPYSGKQGYIAEHRLIMEKHLGRYLTKQEAVHHINHNIADNRIKNLMLFSFCLACEFCLLFLSCACESSLPLWRGIKGEDEYKSPTHQHT